MKSLGTGTSLMHYRLVEKIGEGGMGAVWKARDTSLDRDVAVKLLPAEFSADAERLARFEREAKLLASLNHPNIAAIYGLHEVDGTRFLAMELVAGEDLAQRLARGPLPADETVALGRQIAEALETAHEHGVIHRDLKPANVQITPGGQAKVLDFGLAKSFETQGRSGDPSLSPTVTSAETMAGVMLGTAAYMSPEQVRGTAADKRADIWAFGCVLFEMLTGQRAFPGETISDTLATVLKNEPVWSELPGATPDAMTALIRRCLTKDRQRRLRDIGEARIALEDCQSGAAPVETPTATSAAKPGRFVLWAVVAAAAVLAAFVVGYRLRPPAPEPRPAIDPEVRVRKLTFGPGLEHEPAVSPDGNYVAYTTDAIGNLDIVVEPIGGGNVNRTAAHTADDAQPAWSPDGRQLVFTSARDRGTELGVLVGLGGLSQFLYGQGGDIFIVPALGGPAAKLADQGCYPEWSPDGGSIVYQSDRNGHWDLWTVPARGGTPEPLTDDSEPDLQPAWSPDGNWIAFSTKSGLAVIPAAGGEKISVIEGDEVLDPAWSADGRWLFYSSDRAAASDVMNLWRVEFDPRASQPVEPERITMSEGSDITPSLSRRGRNLAYANVNFFPDIWELTVADRSLKQITFSTSAENFPHVNGDGKTMLMTSDRGGSTQLWLMRIDGSNLQPFTADSGIPAEPRWSPDGWKVAYRLNREGRHSLMLKEKGRVAVEELSAIANSFPAWSPDGEQIAAGFGDGDQTHTGIRILDLDGNERTLFEEKGNNFNPTWSPDGEQIAFTRESDGPRQIWVIPIEGGEARQLTHDDTEYSHPQWSPRDPDTILVVIDHRNLGLLSVATGEVEPITDYQASTIVVDYPSWSFNGKKIYFSVARRSGDIYLLQNY